MLHYTTWLQIVELVYLKDCGKEEMADREERERDRQTDRRERGEDGLVGKRQQIRKEQETMDLE